MSVERRKKKRYTSVRIGEGEEGWGREGAKVLFGHKFVTMTMMLWPEAPPVPHPLQGAWPVEVSWKHFPQPGPHQLPPLES
jgi:hypothetical protein